MSNTECKCFEPGVSVDWIDKADIGVTTSYWEVSRMRCAKCHTPWIRAFIEYEAFPRSGRFYRAPTTDAALEGISPEVGILMIEEAEFKIAGGSHFDGVEHVVSEHGPLMESP